MGQERIKTGGENKAAGRESAKWNGNLVKALHKCIK